MAAERIYLAGPDVFLPNPQAQAAAKKKLCSQYGFEGVFPLDGTSDVSDLAPTDQAFAIAETNEALIRTCDLLIANMTPFRGPSMDVGTAYEMGVMATLGRPVHGYSNVGGTYKDRARPDGMMVEDFGLADNLMMAAAIKRTGGLFLAQSVPVPERDHSLAAFGALLRRIASI